MLFALGNIADEIHQTRPFSSAAEEAVVTLVATANRVRERIAQPIARAGITPQQYNVLRILRGAEPNGLCRNDLRDRMLTRMPDVTRLLDRMEAAGLVSRERSEEDRRLVTTRITARGGRLLERLEAPVAEEHRRRFHGLDEQHLATLIDLLGRVREST
jgi:DNA-binding MarR family transcriptional regulator